MDTITTIQGLLRCNGSAQSVTVALTQSEERLIAAAPDMLTALRGLIKHSSHGDPERDCDECRAVIAARAAIAKALGESHA